MYKVIHKCMICKILIDVVAHPKRDAIADVNTALSRSLCAGQGAGSAALQDDANAPSHSRTGRSAS